MGIFAQVWFWSALAFVAGALLSWALLALPARRQLAELDQSTSAGRESVSRARPSVPPLPERPTRYDDGSVDRRRSSPFDPDPFDEEPAERRPSPFDEEPARVPSPFAAEPAQPVLAPGDEDDYDPFRSDEREPARPGLLSGVDSAADSTSDSGDDDAADRGVLRLTGGQSAAQPTVQVPVSGSLDEGSLFAPPEPPLPSRHEEEAAATQFLPAITAPEPVREIEAPPEVADAGDRGWFEETGDRSEDSAAPSAKDDENLVDDLAVDPRRAESAELVDDVEDIEAPAETGTIFTQRTQPVSGELISSLDGKAGESSSDTKPSEEDAEDEEPQAADKPSSASAPTSVLPVRKPGATRFDTGSRSRPSPPKPEPAPQPAPQPASQPAPQPKQEIEATQAIPAATATAPEPAAEPERARSLFEPIVPADEAATTAMPAPAAASATPARAGDGAFVPPGPFGPGSAMPLPGGGSPSPEFTVKASVTALRYCEPDSPLFGRTVAEVWFRTTKDAERVGFRPLS